MRNILLPATALLTAALGGACLAACTPQGPAEPAHLGQQGASASTAAPAESADAAVDGFPVDTPAAATLWEPCPYVDSQWLAETNGQKVTQVGQDTRFGTPACVFWSYPEAPQATIMVRNLGSVERARAAVDWAAPIEQTEPVEEDGWSGGRGVLGPEQAVYAVQKDSVAVLVWTNQQQTIKAQQIAQEAIANLGL
ncbi:DUF2020 domain-containing protein [Corynebacterium lizhenjunii]|uniref:DUF2020 domain-containing protein n=1 Tax=Corynebacterium lizhenjunii TaxID=2709394 RepID=A0A7T0KEX3_9CORY|nr:DUF2020 domain-containing protein [Corynebacterium lizhenjunii]QPK79045.1 DUF2020 domain-containing protein [Corynebacterium lizhenjunii]